MDLLIVVSRSPWPPRRGDQLRALQAASFLAQAGHRVTLLAPEGDAPSPDRPEPATLPFELETYRRPGLPARGLGVLRAALSGRPLQSGLFAGADLSRRLRELVPRADGVVLQLVRLAGCWGALQQAMGGEGGAEGRGRRGRARPRLVVDLIDSLALSTARRAALDRPWLRPLLALEARRLARWERRLAEAADASLVVAARDLEHLREQLTPAARERLRVLPVAIPEPAIPEPGSDPSGGKGPDLLDPPDPPDLTDLPAGELLVVTGNLGYFPTERGLRWLLDEVWPRLRAARPGLGLVLAGSRASARLRRRVAGEGAAGVVLLDRPPDLGAVLARATLALAPMTAGAGQPLKILEAWAAGVPVVATSWAAAGTTAGVPAGPTAGGDVGEEEGVLVVADGVEAWVRSILGLLEAPEERRRLAAAARRRLVRDYRPERVAGAWAELFAGDGHPGPDGT